MPSETPRGEHYTPARSRARHESAEAHASLRGQLRHISELIRQTEEAIRTNRRSAAAKQGDPELEKDLQALKASLEGAQRSSGRLYALNFLADAVTERAFYALHADDRLVSQFLPASNFECFVVNLDLRQSTTLMGAGKESASFAWFIERVMLQVMSVVKDNFGVFDKFTGDGALVYFPTFFSGADAGLRAFNCAHLAWKLFESFYEEHLSLFDEPPEAGFGAGIGFGNVYVGQFCGALSIVGRPVVSAFRHCNHAKVGQVVATQAAYDALRPRYGQWLSAKQILISQKEHETARKAYLLSLSGDVRKDLAEPDWLVNNR